MPPGKRAIAGVDDSKVLSAAQREKLAVKIRATALSFALGAASVNEIAEINILQATVLAMRRAIARLRVQPDLVLIDGREMRTLGVAHRAVIDGDARCYSVACASIVAKVTRDRLMSSLSVRYPAYGWAKNAGYGTPVHLSALRDRGLTPHHRTLFCSGVVTGE
jgi:ribonuclease HII